MFTLGETEIYVKIHCSLHRVIVKFIQNDTNFYKG